MTEPPRALAHMKHVVRISAIGGAGLLFAACVTHPNVFAAPQTEQDKGPLGVESAVEVDPGSTRLVGQLDEATFFAATRTTERGTENCLLVVAPSINYAASCAQSAEVVFQGPEFGDVRLNVDGIQETKEGETQLSEFLAVLTHS